MTNNSSLENQLKKIQKNSNHNVSSEKINKFDLLIIDDTFPSIKSGFRYTEFTTYLHEFKNSLIVTSGKNIESLDKRPATSVIRDYKEKFPHLSHKVILKTKKIHIKNNSLVYLNFLNNVFSILPQIEAAKASFVFTLYPGGGFLLNDPICDRKLKRIFSSPYFKKVIVTQQVTYNYIINKGMCTKEKVQMIFGVVMPEISKKNLLTTKHRWGFDKSRLDICFMAHKYTTHGQDKGYDVFIDVATKLHQSYKNIYFHVIGSFDPKVINVDSLGDHIKFHGSLNPEDFDNLFKTIDIILSPNISGKISPGSFDGFPTASCIEAALRGSAIFATDEFNSAEGYFMDGENIVLIKYNTKDIIDKIEYYYNHPYNLKKIGENGMHHVRELYNLETQIKPRINLLYELGYNTEQLINTSWKILKLNIQWKLFSILNTFRKISIKSTIKIKHKNHKKLTLKNRKRQY